MLATLGSSVMVLAGILVVVELLARLWIRTDRRYFVFQPRARIEMDLDRGTHPQLEPHVTFAINSDGERGDEPPNVDRVFRVVVAGGSSTECYFLDQRSAWPALVQAHLSTPSSLARLGVQASHVGSLGTSGVHAGTLNLIMRRTLPRYESLDLTILMVGVGDVLRWLTEGAPSDGALSVRLDWCFARHPEVNIGFTPRSSGIAEVLRRVRSHWRPPFVTRENAGRWLGRARAMRARATEMRDVMPDPVEFLAAYERNLRETVHVVRAHSRQLLLLQQPWFEKEPYTDEEQRLMWNGGVGEVMDGELTAFYTDRVLFQLWRLVSERTARVAAELDVACVDLLPLVPSVMDNYYDHVHHTVAGSQIIAEAVAEKVLSLMGREGMQPGAGIPLESFSESSYAYPPRARRSGD
jgi:lysophospholipase L1-like esterase